MALKHPDLKKKNIHKSNHKGYYCTVTQRNLHISVTVFVGSKATVHAQKIKQLNRTIQRNQDKLQQK